MLSWDILADPSTKFLFESHGQKTQSTFFGWSRRVWQSFPFNKASKRFSYTSANRPHRGSSSTLTMPQIKFNKSFSSITSTNRNVAIHRISGQWRCTSVFPSFSLKSRCQRSTQFCTNKEDELKIVVWMGWIWGSFQRFLFIYKPTVTVVFMEQGHIDIRFCFNKIEWRTGLVKWKHSLCLCRAFQKPLAYLAYDWPFWVIMTLWYPGSFK